MRHVSRAVGMLLLVCALAACGSERAAPTLTPSPSPTLTVTPSPSPTPRPTWTPSPVMTRTPRATSTPAPTFTPRPTRTPTPGITPGPAWEGENRLVVILPETDLNAGIAKEYAGRDMTSPSRAPTVKLGYGESVRVEMHFYNDFLQRDGMVLAKVMLNTGGGRLTLAEFPEGRTQSGALTSNRAVNMALALVENGLNRALTQATAQESNPPPLVAVHVYPGYLKAIYQR